VLSIDSYLAEPPDAADPNAILQALAEIKTAEARPMWQAKVKIWTDRLGRAEESGKPKEGGN